MVSTWKNLKGWAHPPPGSVSEASGGQRETTPQASGSSPSVRTLCFRASVVYQGWLGLAVKVVFCWHTGHLWRKVTTLHFSPGPCWFRTTLCPHPGFFRSTWTRKRKREVNTCVFNVWGFCCYGVFLDVCPAGWKSESERSTRKGLFPFQKNSPHYSVDGPWRPVLSETSQTPEDRWYMIPLICGSE